MHSGGSVVLVVEVLVVVVEVVVVPGTASAGLTVSAEGRSHELHSELRPLSV